MCSTRRYGHSCGEPIVKAEQLEGQLVDWIRYFQPEGELLDLLLQTLQAEDTGSAEQPAEQRSELFDQLRRLQDLYVLGDLTKPQYVMRRQALEEEVQRLGPPTQPATDRARALLDDFPRFWDLETQPVERRKLLLSLFGQIWAQEGRIVAVQPHDDFLPYFQAAQQNVKHHPTGGGWCRRRERRGSNPRLSPRRSRSDSRPLLSARVPGAGWRRRRHGAQIVSSQLTETVLYGAVDVGVRLAGLGPGRRWADWCQTCGRCVDRRPPGICGVT